MFDLIYHGNKDDFDKIDNLNLRIDLIDGGFDQIGNKISISLQDSNAVYVKDDSIDGYKVYIPFSFNQMMDANTILYEQSQMQFSFKILIDYDKDNQGQTQQMQFAQAVFGVETPYDIAKWLLKT